MIEATITSKMTIMMTTNEDDDLVESEYEISDGVSGIWVIPIIEVKDKVQEQLVKRNDKLKVSINEANLFSEELKQTCK